MYLMRRSARWRARCTHGPRVIMPDSTPRRSVLVVDDDEDIRLILQDTLELGGYEVACAADGRAAIDYLKEAAAPPSLVLLDLMMPVMSGWEFRDEQRGDERLSGIPVVILTASRAANVGSAAEGAADVLYKPVDLDRLLSVVDRCSAHVH
jgi:CheY-like chemotaxis protein